MSNNINHSTENRQQIKNLTPSCQHCLLSASQLNISEHRIKKGDFSSHLVLCRGRNKDGNPLGIENKCLAPNCNTPRIKIRTAAAWEQHYSRCHKIKLRLFRDLKSLHRHLQPWQAPDFEMNGDWGYFLTKKSPIQEFETLRRLWDATLDPLKFQAETQHKLISEYRNDFIRILQATPISWHAHASDVWAILPSVLALLEADSPSRGSRLSQAQKRLCRLATFEKQMVSYHGPMAHGGTGLKWHTPSTCLGDPQVIAIEDAVEKRILLLIFKSLVQSGHVAVVLEMVRQRDGRVVTAAEWNTICECCEEAGIYLAVDEVLTAWRCGAPFVHLLPEYSKYKPSFVVFGKAVGASGLAIHWQGIHVDRLGYKEDDRMDFIHLWDHKSSRAIDPNEALRSWGYIQLSEKDQWCKRSLRIGENLRKVLQEFNPEIEVNGLGAFLYIPAEVARTMDIVGAAVDSSFTRWLPYLDEGLDDLNRVYEMFNPSGWRGSLVKSVTNFVQRRCISCSDFIFDIAYGPCHRCSGYICQVCEQQGDHRRHNKGECLKRKSIGEKG